MIKSGDWQRGLDLANAKTVRDRQTKADAETQAKADADAKAKADAEEKERLATAAEQIKAKFSQSNKKDRDFYNNLFNT